MICTEQFQFERPTCHLGKGQEVGVVVGVVVGVAGPSSPRRHPVQENRSDHRWTTTRFHLNISLLRHLGSRNHNTSRIHFRSHSILDWGSLSLGFVYTSGHPLRL